MAFSPRHASPRSFSAPLPPSPLVLMMMACQVWSSWLCAFAVPCRSAHLSPAWVVFYLHTPSPGLRLEMIPAQEEARLAEALKKENQGSGIRPVLARRRLEDAGGLNDTWRGRGGRGRRAWQRAGMRARVICWSGSGQKDRRGVHGALVLPRMHYALGAWRARRMARAKVSDSRR